MLGNEVLLLLPFHKEAPPNPPKTHTLKTNIVYLIAYMGSSSDSESGALCYWPVLISTICLPFLAKSAGIGGWHPGQYLVLAGCRNDRTGGACKSKRPGSFRKRYSAGLVPF